MSKTSLDKSKIKFLLLEGVHQSAVDVLKAAGYTSIEYLTGSLPEAQLKEKIADAHFIGIRSRTQMDKAAFEAHGASEHFKELGIGQLFGLMENRERAFYETLD